MRPPRTPELRAKLLAQALSCRRFRFSDTFDNAPFDVKRELRQWERETYGRLRDHIVRGEAALNTYQRKLAVLSQTCLSRAEFIAREAKLHREFERSMSQLDREGQS